MRFLYPNSLWEPTKFRWKSKKSTQRGLFLLVRRLFPDYEVEENYKHQDLFFTTGIQMELDILITELKVAIEYNGKQHYDNTYFSQPGFRERDFEKREACERIGITLLVVPYWWDNTLEGLIGILQVHPHLESVIYSRQSLEFL
eukprot:TRINITY_DN4706_c0_g1_i17.p1 TRINITY_DN4706_c0_g1~~TRINITY_DN4706_c0_g1_i17.p1  ORF type:complete len:144 (-),score=20.50 TRINITY_DN4706_c0_g1_i17:304-735(-)